MPEFQLKVEPHDAWYNGLDDFTKGYIEAAFFTDTGSQDDADNGLADACVSELAPQARVMITVDCREFQEKNAKLLQCAYLLDYDEEQAGRDFWFTRNGHGVGFWDRDALEVGTDITLGEELSDRCSGWGERHLYRGDDELIYVG